VSPRLEEQLVFFGCLLVAIILHEISHGVVALWLGDDTAKRAGRLTLNPVSHIDPFGSIVLPAMLTLSGLGAFGYAKPVPVNPAGLRHPRRDMLFVSLAGPSTNFLLMAMAAMGARAAFATGTGGATRIAELPLATEVLLYFALANMFLGVFNLMPIPPLDGSSIVERAVPADWLPTWYRIRPYGFVVLLVLVFATNIVGKIFAPIERSLFDFIAGQ
jgi:Zn-dependent protease